MTYSELLVYLKNWDCARNCGVNYYSKSVCGKCEVKYNGIFGTLYPYGEYRYNDGRIYSSDDIIEIVLKAGI